MNGKYQKRRFAGEALIMLASLALLLFTTRLWPLLLLAILGIFAAMIRMVFLSTGQAETVTPARAMEPEAKEPTAADMRAMAFTLIVKRVTAILQADYPDVHWVWENAEPKKDIMEGLPVYARVNRAGGYGRMHVVIKNLQVCDVVPVSGASGMKPLQGGERHTDSGDSAEPQNEDGHQAVNYGLLAFEWVEAHVAALNESCNEAIAKGENMFLIPEDELPAKDSWQEICRELERNGLDNAVCRESGIRINFTR